ncbi:MAG: HxlR family transcriptional regulator [Amycolatopsis sp.]|uniref:winged helix-turn-helix transcriptional regulator n=1 Tax=Amycolatopsis sp. TaxID=37632 RepID=UPI0026275DBA|nr:helix-turn-helix domain-containing protein [Amycolatopsis sp.]MCU1682535.1 HxlR family transcriptional regulator [Amycolatopsis sp.]
MQRTPFDKNCPTRQLLDRIGDQWTVLIIGAVSAGPLRFTEIGKRVEGISQKVLTQTLRSLVRDGMLTRTAYATIPPRVDYELTDLGRDLVAPLAMLTTWAQDHMDQVVVAREAFDSEQAALSV